MLYIDNVEIRYNNYSINRSLEGDEIFKSTANTVTAQVYNTGQNVLALFKKRIKITENNITIFEGVIDSADKNEDGMHIDIKGRDLVGYYFIDNDAPRKIYNNTTPEDIIKDLAVFAGWSLSNLILQTTGFSISYYKSTEDRSIWEVMNEIAKSVGGCLNLTGDGKLKFWSYASASYNYITAAKPILSTKGLKEENTFLNVKNYLVAEMKNKKIMEKDFVWMYVQDPEGNDITVKDTKDGKISWEIGKIIETQSASKAAPFEINLKHKINNPQRVWFKVENTTKGTNITIYATIDYPNKKITVNDSALSEQYKTKAGDDIRIIYLTESPMRIAVKYDYSTEGYDFNGEIVAADKEIVKEGGGNVAETTLTADEKDSDTVLLISWSGAEILTKLGIKARPIVSRTDKLTVVDADSKNAYGRKKLEMKFDGLDQTGVNRTLSYIKKRFANPYSRISFETISDYLIDLGDIININDTFRNITGNYEITGLSFKKSIDKSGKITEKMNINAIIYPVSWVSSLSSSTPVISPPSPPPIVVSINAPEINTTSTVFSKGSIVNLSWKGVNKAVGYVIRYSYDPSDSAKWKQSYTTETSIGIEVEQNKDVYLEIKAVGNGESTWSSRVNIRSAKDPDAPANPGAVSLTQGVGLLLLQWEKVLEANYYEIQRCNSSDNSTFSTYITIVNVETNFYVDRDINYGKYYKYRIRAVKSNEVWSTWTESNVKQCLKANYSDIIANKITANELELALRLIAGQEIAVGDEQNGWGLKYDIGLFRKNNSNYLRLSSIITTGTADLTGIKQRDVSINWIDTNYDVILIPQKFKYWDNSFNTTQNRNFSFFASNFSSTGFKINAFTEIAGEIGSKSTSVSYNYGSSGVDVYIDLSTAPGNIYKYILNLKRRGADPVVDTLTVNLSPSSKPMIRIRFDWSNWDSKYVKERVRVDYTNDGNFDWDSGEYWIYYQGASPLQQIVTFYLDTYQNSADAIIQYVVISK